MNKGATNEDEMKWRQMERFDMPSVERKKKRETAALSGLQ